MNKNLIDALLLAVVFAFLVVGVIFLSLSILAPSGGHDLIIALACITAGNFLGLFRIAAQRCDEPDGSKVGH